ncbi:rhomboid family intramembrane serine protease [candidate division KSB3 bacterium]|uniref:Rhomboid family intramembrane serine protease n=1 Tax=candidate division KSB3 bacterium TaxID=2044937 RepID=A0A9D5K0F9_9BACT|nr:rhomboid family intramembrane serine protease [candidate division KSB3 bacterium]MBD3327336.1 rhomboid family intramembrane serine protease [candidate division KSB3 bacterium]
MFLPIGDTPNPRNFTPWINWMLIAANVAIFIFISLPLSSRGVNVNDPLLQEYVRYVYPSLRSVFALRQMLSQISSYDIFVFAHGYKPGAPEMLDLLFSLFLHANLLHLAGNMLFLWIYGDNVEYRLGRIGYLITYLITGVIATLVFSLFAGNSMMPLIGASGAISGVLGVYFLLFPRNQIKVFVALFPFFFNVVLLPARLVLGIYVVLDNLLPFLTGAQSGVAYGAHIGGFVSGFLIAWVGEQFTWRWPWSDRFWRLGKGPKKRPTPGASAEPSPLAEVRAALADQAPERAIAAIGNLERQDIADLSPNECVSLAHWLDDTGHPIAATRLLRRCLSNHPQSDDLADVYLVLGLMRLRQGQPTAAYQYLLSVFDHDPSPETAARARQALAQIDIFRRKR